MRIEIAEFLSRQWRFTEYQGGDPAAFVISLNLKRRHLSESQRAMVAGKLAKMPKGANQHTPIGAPSKAVVDQSPEWEEQTMEGQSRKLPSNFDRLHRHELDIRSKTISSIESDAELMDHVELVESVMDTLNFFSVQTPADLDQETVQLLGARVFNDLSAAMGQLFSGYYQIAAAIQRDVMEIVFLLDMFGRDNSKIKLWRDSDHKLRREHFQPGKVRDFLDSSDGFKEGKRGQNYRMFCEYAAHPTYKGFALMGPGGKSPNIGPFFDVTLIKAVLQEQAQLAAQAGNNFSVFFDANSSVSALKTKLYRLEMTSNWMERYFGRKADRKGINKLKKMLAEISE